MYSQSTKKKMRTYLLVLLLLGCLFLVAFLTLLFVFLFYVIPTRDGPFLPPYREVPRILAPQSPAYPSNQNLPLPQFTQYVQPFPSHVKEKSTRLSHVHEFLTVHWNGHRRTGVVGMFQPQDPLDESLTNDDLVCLPLVTANERDIIQFGFPSVLEKLAQYYFNIPAVLNQGGEAGRADGIDLLVGTLENIRFSDSLRMWVAYRVLVEGVNEPGGYCMAREVSVPYTLDCKSAFIQVHAWDEQFTDGADLILVPVPKDMDRDEKGDHLRVTEVSFETHGDTVTPHVNALHDMVFPDHHRVLAVAAKRNVLFVLCWDGPSGLHQLYQYRYDASEKEYIRASNVHAPQNNSLVCNDTIIYMTETQLAVSNGRHELWVYQRTNVTSSHWSIVQQITLAASEWLLDVRLSEDGLLLAALTQNDTQQILYVWRWDFASLTFLEDADEPTRMTFPKPTEFELGRNSFDLHMSFDDRVVQLLLLQDEGLRVLQWDF